MPYYNLPIDDYGGILTLNEHNKLIDMLLASEDFSDDKLDLGCTVKRSKWSHTSNNGSVCAAPKVKRELHLFKLRQKIKEMFNLHTNTVSTLKAGCSVQTKHTKIAPLSDRAVVSRRSHVHACGNVIRPIEYFPEFYLTYFYSETDFFYVTDDAVTIVNLTLTLHIIGPSSTNSIGLESTKPETAKTTRNDHVAKFCNQRFKIIIHPKLMMTLPSVPLLICSNQSTHG